MATVTLDGVRKSYGAREVVHGVGCAVGDGELVVVVGPSGCGKSTLLRMVAGLEAVSAGTVTIDGRVINGVEPKDRDIAMVFQNYALYPHMSVYNNMAYGLRMRRMDRALIGTRVERATAILQIEGLPERKPRPLSGGQRQRVAMGRAIVRDPKVFLFDEPLSNLDAQLRDEMRGEIKRLHLEISTTMIYVTHDQIEAMTLADRIVLMRDGVIEQQGAPLDLFERPATRFVAGFLGKNEIVVQHLLRQLVVINEITVEIGYDHLRLGLISVFDAGIAFENRVTCFVFTIFEDGPYLELQRRAVFHLQLQQLANFQRAFRDLPVRGCHG